MENPQANKYTRTQKQTHTYAPSPVNKGEQITVNLRYPRITTISFLAPLVYIWCRPGCYGPGYSRSRYGDKPLITYCRVMQMCGFWKAFVQHFWKVISVTVGTFPPRKMKKNAGSGRGLYSAMECEGNLFLLVFWRGLDEC